LAVAAQAALEAGDVDLLHGGILLDRLGGGGGGTFSEREGLGFEPDRGVREVARGETNRDEQVGALCASGCDEAIREHKRPRRREEQGLTLVGERAVLKHEQAGDVEVEGVEAEADGIREVRLQRDFGLGHHVFADEPAGRAPPQTAGRRLIASSWS